MLNFNRYLRFIDSDGEVISPSLWGVYTFPDGQNQFHCLPSFQEEAVRLDVSVCDPAVLDIAMQVMMTMPVSVRVLYKYGGRSDKDRCGHNLAANVARQYTNLFEQLAVREVEYLVPHDHSGTLMAYRPPIDLEQYAAVIFPDLSARARQPWIPDDFPHITAAKVRDQESGQITAYSLEGVEPEKKYLIADDLCDGGATFLKLGEAMEGSPADRDLYVTHGVFSKGSVFDMTRTFNAVFTTNSYTRPEPNGVLRDAYASGTTRPRRVGDGELTVFNVWGLP